MTGSSSARLQPPRWPAGDVFSIGIALFVAGALSLTDAPWPVRLTFAAVPLTLLVAWLAARALQHLWWPQLLASLEAHDNAVDAVPERNVGGWIVLASGLGLFVELMLIRWHGSMFHLFAIYKNVSLLAAFLGLGLGYARGDMRPLATPLVLPAIAGQIVLLYSLSYTTLADYLHNPVAEQTVMGLGAIQSLSNLLLVYGFLILMFGLTVLTCIPLGQVAARLMQRREPLAAYSANLAGSLLGIFAFTATGYLWSPPAVWLLVAATGLGCFLSLAPSRATVVPAFVSVAIALGLLATPLDLDLAYVYSPYQVLSLLQRRGDTPEVLANHAYFQHIIDLGEKAQANHPERRVTAAYYEVPYTFQPHPADVLVVGSGTGNDVAAALRRGAGHVDAVEIDPVILELGRRLHPENPYGDERVQPIVDDARTYIRRTDRRYDLIVYGLLDSHTQLSTHSSVRLDSFVYTVEGFREARARLKPGGLVVMTFSLSNHQQGRKLFEMIKLAFDGKEPRVYSAGYDAGTSYVIGDQMPEATGVAIPDVTDDVKAVADHVDVSTDDWPFLYMSQRTFPVSYVLVIFLLLGVSWLVTRDLLPWGVGRVQPVSFLLGAGFMLVETKSITELGLTLGNTWQVISTVITGILLMAYFANRIILARGRISDPLAYGMLVVSLAVGFVVSAHGLAGLPPLVAGPLMVLILSVPMFFSGFAFSNELSTQGNVSKTLSSNLLGAMLGGFLEYNSMAFGFRSLYVLALLLYGAAFLFARRRA